MGKKSFTLITNGIEYNFFGEGIDVAIGFLKNRYQFIPEEFIRNAAYLLYENTGNPDHLENWVKAEEKLCGNDPNRPILVIPDDQWEEFKKSKPFNFYSFTSESFVRDVASQIYRRTGNEDALENWVKAKWMYNAAGVVILSDDQWNKHFEGYYDLYCR